MSHEAIGLSCIKCLQYTCSSILCSVAHYEMFGDWCLPEWIHVDEPSAIQRPFRQEDESHVNTMRDAVACYMDNQH